MRALGMAARRLSSVMSLTDLIAEPHRAATLSADTALALLVQVAPVYAALQARAAAGTPGSHDEGRLLRAGEAAQKLGLTVTALYKQAPRLPFTVRNGRALRFSETGIDEYIRGQQR